MSDPQDAPSHTTAPGDAVIEWSLTGWTPQLPFRGSLDFTDEGGGLILRLPLEPMVVRDLRDALTAVLDAQYAAFTQTPAPAPPAPAPPAAAPAAPPTSEGVQKPEATPSGYWWSSAFKVTVKPTGVKILIALGAAMVLLIIVNQFTAR